MPTYWLSPFKRKFYKIFHESLQYLTKFATNKSVASASEAYTHSCGRKILVHKSYTEIKKKSYVYSTSVPAKHGHVLD